MHGIWSPCHRLVAGFWVKRVEGIRLNLGIWISARAGVIVILTRKALPFVGKTANLATRVVPKCRIGPGGGRGGLGGGGGRGRGRRRDTSQ